jgi:hypothetical protein
VIGAVDELHLGVGVAHRRDCFSKVRKSLAGRIAYHALGPHALGTRDLRLESIDVVHAGNRTFPLTDSIRALTLRDIEHELTGL